MATIKKYNPFTGTFDYIAETTVEGADNTAALSVSNPDAESIRTPRSTQQQINIDTKDSVNSLDGRITQNEEVSAALADASMVVSNATTFYAGTTETQWDFTTASPSSDTEILDANETTNLLQFKQAGLRYITAIEIGVRLHSTAQKTLTIRLRNDADDSLLYESSIVLVGEVNEVKYLSDEVNVIKTLEDNVSVYATVQATDSDVEMLFFYQEVYVTGKVPDSLNVNTGDVTVTDQAKESLSGSAATQAEVNKETVQMDKFSRDLTALNRETDLFIADASAVITQAPPSVAAPTTETKWAFTTTKDSTNEILLTVDDANNEATFKKVGIKYNWDLLMKVNNISGVANTITTKVKRKADDVTIQIRTIDVPAEVGHHYFALNTVSETNDATDTTVYITIQAAQPNLEVIEASSRIYAETPSVNADTMHWAQVWDTSGTKTYYRNDVVRDDNFLSICIAPVSTTDRPAPQHSGNIEYQMNYDGSGWETVTLADTPEVDTGHDMEVVNGGWFYGGRVWLFDDDALEQTIAAGVVHADGTFEAIFRYTVPQELITQEGWFDFRISQPMGVFPNTTFGLDIMIKSIASWEDVASGIWEYAGIRESEQQPYWGSWGINQAGDYLQIHKNQNDQLGEVDLTVVEVGDIIELQQNPVMWKFEVTGIDTFQNNCYRFNVAEEIMDGVMTAQQNTDIKITRLSTSGGSVKYVRVVDGTLPYDNIKGIKDWVYDDNMYGTDFFFEDAIQSPDWEVIAYSPFNASVNGGGDGGATMPATTLDVTPHDAKVESVTGNASSQYDINKEAASSINIVSGEVEQISEVVEYTSDAAIHIETDATAALPAAEHTVDFVNADAPTFPDIMDADETDNHIIFKKADYRYIGDYYLIIQTSDDEVEHQLAIRLRKVSDNSIISEKQVSLPVGTEVHHVYMPLVIVDNTEADNAISITLEAGDDTLTLLEFHGHGYAKALTSISTTDDLPEGSTNLYYTEARVSANSDVSANTTDRHSHTNKSVLDAITSAGSGSIITASERTAIGSIPSSLNDLSDVSITTPSTNDILQYNGTDWVAAALANYGDMDKATYDPQGIGADAFNYSNFTNTPAIPSTSDDLTEGSTNLFYTEARVSANTDVAANTSDRHTHTNKSILDNTQESFTTALKNKLDGIDDGAEVNVNADWNAVSGDAQIYNKPIIPVNISDLGDVNTSGAANADVLQFDGTNWVPATISTGGGDMYKTTYDTTGINADAFDYNNFFNTPTIITAHGDLTGRDAADSHPAASISIADANNYYNALTVEDALAEIGETKDTNGYDLINPNSLPALTFDDATRTFSVSVKSGQTEYYYWANGKKITNTTTKTVVIPDVTGTYYIIFDDDNNLIAVLEQDLVLENFYENAITGLVYWNAEDQESIPGVETHGHIMDARTHQYNHATFGVRYEGGIDIEGLVDQQATYSQTTSGAFWDEDIRHIVNAQTTHQFLYRWGTTGRWRLTPTKNNEIGYKPDGADHYVYNYYDGNTWTLSEGAADTDFYIQFFVGVPRLDESNRVVKLIAQTAYPNKTAARAAIESEMRRIRLDGLPSPEITFLYAALIKRNGLLQVLDDGSLYYDLRVIRGGAGSASNSANLASDVIYDNTSSGLAATNVQAAIDELATTVSGLPTSFTELSDVADSDYTGKAGQAPLVNSTEDALVLDVVVVPNTTGTTSTVLDIWTGTQAEYDALGTYNSTTLYFIQ